MATATLTHRHIFGLKGDVKDNIWFVDENLVVYPAGHNTIIYNSENKVQKFMHGTDGTEGITAVSVSPSKRFVAISERSDRGLVNVFDLHTLKRRKILSTNEVLSKEYVSLCFSADNKLLLTLGGAPDWTLVCWMWEKAKPIATVKVSNEVKAPVYEASFNPVDPTVTCVSGKGILKFFRLADNTFQSMPTLNGQDREQETYTSHAWLPEDRVILGTDSGNIFLVESDEVCTLLPGSPGGGISIHCMVAYSKGFICGGEGATLWVYDHSEDNNQFQLFRTLRVLGQTAAITNVSVSPSEDSVAVSLANNQLYTLSLSSLEVAKPDEMQFTVLGSPNHGRYVTGMDTCARKPLLVTCGRDRTVRVWNYVEKTEELCKPFPEEAYSVAFHPSGLHILVGFSDKLRLMNLLMDDIRQVKEFPIKACRECRFSHGGHLFAAVSNNAISVINTYTCEPLYSNPLRGHNSKVLSLYWSLDDYGLISAGSDGAVYQWELADTPKREGEFVQKGCNYSSALCSADGSLVWAVGNDRKMKEIEFPTSNVSKEFDAHAVLGQLALSHNQRMLFAGASDPDRPGPVRSYKFSLTGDYLEYPCLGGAVTRLAVSLDDRFLFAAGEDGAVAIMEIHEKGEGVLKRRREELAVPFAEEILVTKSDLEEKTALMSELKNKVEELTLHNEYQLRLKDMTYNDKIKEVTEKYTQELEQDKNKYELLREEKNDMEMEFEEKIKQMEEKHQHELQEMEATYQQKIMAEVERYQQLVHERDLQQERWDDQQRQLIQAHERNVAEITEDYEHKLEEDRQMRRAMQEEKAELLREFTETNRQLEADIDQEIVELKQRYDNKLNAERDATLRYKGENGIMKKKFTALQKDIEVQRDEIKRMLEKEKELVEGIRGLEREIQAHKREIRERDETIGEKEKKIYDLKKKNQELEKFKFVLDYKIKDLKRQIEPRENEITDMKEQIKEMDHELEQYHRSNAALDLMIGELRARLDAMQAQIMGQRQKLSDQHSRIRRFRSELHDCVQMIQDPARLRDAVTRLYKRHVQEQPRTEELDSDIQREYHRQREYLEKSVEALKRRLSRDSALHAADNLRAMQANMGLIKEINELRREAKLIRQTARDAEVLGTAGAPAGGGWVPQPAMEHVASPSQARQQVLMEQREELGQLKAQLEQMQAGMVMNRPVSREQLPPMDGIFQQQQQIQQQQQRLQYEQQQ